MMEALSPYLEPEELIETLNNQKIYLEKGESCIIDAQKLVEDPKDETVRSLELLTHTGKLIMSLRRNPMGNKEEQSYTVTLPNGYQFLLPIPYYNFVVGTHISTIGVCLPATTLLHVSPKHCVIDIEAAGNIQITDNNSEKGTSYIISEHTKVSNSQEDIPRAELSPERWQSFCFESPQYLTLYGKDGNALGSILTLSHTGDEYIFCRYSDGERLILDKAKVIALSSFLGFKCDLQVRGKIIYLQGSHDIEVGVAIQPIIEKVPLGQNGIIEAFMNGGRKIAGVTLRQTDNPKYSKYFYLNGDNMAVNTKTGRIVVADGIGQPGNESHASSLVTEVLTNSSQKLTDALHQAHWLLKYRNSYYIDFQKCDTVLAAADIQGDTLNTVVLGDSKWCIVRKGRIIYRSREHSEAGERYEAGLLGEKQPEGPITLYEKLTSPQQDIVTSSLLTMMKPGCAPDSSYLIRDPNTENWVKGEGPITLEKGDRLVLMSDGGDALTDEEIVQGVSGKEAKESVADLITKVEEKNKHAKYDRYCDDGGTPVEIDPPFDNVTLLVYVHN